MLGAPGLVAHGRSSGLKRRVFREDIVQQKPFLQGFFLLEGDPCQLLDRGSRSRSRMVPLLPEGI